MGDQEARRGDDFRERADQGAAELGRRAGRLLRRGRPRLERAVKEARPRIEEAAEKAKPQVERAARDSWRFAQEHEDEIKRAALRGARLKFRGPFGFVIDALASGLQAGEQQTAPRCPACGAPHGREARFCNQCGAGLNATQG
jgi:hypothetical protein